MRQWKMSVEQLLAYLVSLQIETQLFLHVQLQSNCGKNMFLTCSF